MVFFNCKRHNLSVQYSPFVLNMHKETNSH